MKPLSSGVNLPNKSVIDQWNNINDLPIVGTSPRNVPMSTVFSFPLVNVEIYAGDNLDNLKRINDLIKLLEKDIFIIYQIRSRATGLKEEIDGKIPYEKYSANVIQMLNDFQTIYQDLNNHSTTAVMLICQIFSQPQIWNEGFYYRELLDQLCFLVFKIFSLYYVYSEKTSIINDIEILISLLQGHDDNKECIEYIQNVQKRFSVKNGFKDEIVQRLIETDAKPQQIKDIFNIIWKHVETATNEHSYIQADTETAYIIALLIMVDIYRDFLQHERQQKPTEKESNLILCNLPDNVYSFLHEYRENHPYLVLVFELSVDFDQCCTNYNFAEKEDPFKKENFVKKIFSITSKKLDKKESLGLSEIRNDLFTMFQLFSQSSSAIFAKLTNENINVEDLFLEDEDTKANDKEPIPNDIDQNSNKKDSNLNNKEPNPNDEDEKKSNDKITSIEAEGLLLDLIRVLQNSNFAIHSIREFIALKYKLAQSKQQEKNNENANNKENENIDENNNNNDNNNENKNDNDNTNNNENNKENNNENANNNENTNNNENVNNNENTNNNENKQEDNSSINKPTMSTEEIIDNEIAEAAEDFNNIPRSIYEIAMNDEIEDDERDNIMKILTICRLFRELITSNYFKIFSLLSAFILKEVDKFILKSFSSINEHSKPVYDVIKSDIDEIVDVTSAQCPSHAKEMFLIKLLRAKVQQFLNPESKGRMTGKGNIFTKGTTLNNDDIKLLNRFLKKSLYYNDILQLNQTLSVVFDQSSLYFKETFLDSYRSYYLKKMPKEAGQRKKAIYFPLTSSLPFMLINMAIKRADNHGELVGTMFYPFSIYDDAATVALNMLESKSLYDEILAESSQTLLLINWSFSHYAFKTVKTYLTERFVDERLQSMGQPPIYKKFTNVNKNSIMRIQNFLQQNQLFIVGHHTNLKSNIAKLLEQIFIKEIVSYEKIIEVHGISSIFVFSSMMQIFRTMHTFFTECDTPLASFEEIMHISLESGAPDSFSSKVYNSISESLLESIIPTYALYTNPYRLFSITNDTNFSAYLRSSKNSIPASILGQTIDGIGVKHFREILYYIDDGGMYKIFLKLKEMIVSNFNSFLEVYREEKSNIHRIKDSPLGLGSNNTFSNYEKIYGLLVKNKKLDSIFTYLRTIGNIIIIAEMIDDAYALKNLSEKQFNAYLFMCKSVDENPEKIMSSQLDETHDDIFIMFSNKFKVFKEMCKWDDQNKDKKKDDEKNDNENNNDDEKNDNENNNDEKNDNENNNDDDNDNYQQPIFNRSSYLYTYTDTFSSTSSENLNRKLVVAPKSDEILHPFKQVILKLLVNCIKSEEAYSCFEETSQNLLDFPSLTGFAAVWSVLEFVYFLKECYHNNYFKADKGKASPLAKYGESVFISSSIILDLTNQVHMSRALSIGEQIYRQNCVEKTSKSNIVSNFLTIYDFAKASTNCIMCSLKPALNSLKNQK